MKIIRNSKILIDNVKIGGTFLYRGELHMKVSPGGLCFTVQGTFNNIILNLETNKLDALNGNKAIYVESVGASISVE